MNLSGLFRNVVLILQMFAVPLSALAAANITISPSGTGSYLIDADGFSQVAAVEFMITYDTNGLSNPRLTQGPLLSGTLAAVNPNMPGVIRLAAVSTKPIAASGRIASVVFESRGAPGGILSFSARLMTLSGTAIPVVASIANLPVSAPASNEPNASVSAIDTAEDAPAGTGTMRTVIPMLVGAAQGTRDTLPGHELTPDNTPAGEEKTGAIIIASREPVSEKIQAQQNRTIYTQQSILDRFRKYQGERTPKALISLFEREEAIGFRQEPRLALANGKEKVKAIFTAPSTLKAAPDVAIAGARLISLGRHPDFTNTWIAELKPHRNAEEVILTVPLREITFVLPVTIVRPAAVDLDKSGKVTERDFQLFLQGPGVGKKAGFDLNGDGKRNYRDDFIYTANYLLLHEAGEPAQ